MRVYEGFDTDKLFVTSEPEGSITFEILKDTHYSAITMSRKTVRQLINDLELFEKFDKLERRIKETRYDEIR